MNHHTSSYNPKGRKRQFQAGSGNLDWWLWPFWVSAFQRTCQVALCLWYLSQTTGPIQHTHNVDHPEWFSHLVPGQNLGQGTVSEPFIYWGWLWVTWCWELQAKFSGPSPSRSISTLVDQFSSVTQSCLTLCDPMVCSTPGFPVHHQLPEPTQTHVQWCYPTISSSVVPCSSCLQSFPASRSFPVSWFFTSGGQSIGVSASASVLPMNIQDWFPLGWTGWISLQYKGLSRVFSNTTVQKHQFFSAQLSL